MPRPTPSLARLVRWPVLDEHRVKGSSMHWVRITKPRYEQSSRHAGRIGEVVGHWGPENSADGREGYLVEFTDGEIVGVTDDEVEMVDGPHAAERAGEPGTESGGADEESDAAA